MCTSRSRKSSTASMPFTWLPGTPFTSAPTVLISCSATKFDEFLLSRLSTMSSVSLAAVVSSFALPGTEPATRPFTFTPRCCSNCLRVKPK